MTTGLILMTAMPPTLGHEHLIRFAANYSGVDAVFVIVCTRGCEPIQASIRYNAIADLAEGIKSNAWINVCNLHRDVPQHPGESASPADFWRAWKEIVEEHVFSPVDIVFASERYGIELAACLGAQFVPCNTYRETINISATKVRRDPLANFAKLMPTFQPVWRRKVTFFGAESTGKTTMAKYLAGPMNAHFVPEWAREYLELIGPEVTDEKMDTIMRGQYAAQTATEALRDKPFIFQDTDLLSTIGYYRLYGGRIPGEMEMLFQRTVADLYIVMNDAIEFEPDPLRYGGDKRESGSGYWIDLLKARGLKHHVVVNTDRRAQAVEIAAVIRSDFLDNCNFDAMSGFQREAA